ncbi:MAG: hypothetical protein OEZ34_15100 [Spirochaetia bacterium]|nr:hypothetical protein [Spirochaetia bacterium]
MSEQAENARESLVIASKCKAYIKNAGCMVSSDAMEALSEKVYEILDQAVKRTKENKRTTLRPHDL